MILELENLRYQVQTVIEQSLIPSAIQSPEDEIVTHVVPHDADGNLYVIDGVIDISVLAESVADALWADREVGNGPGS